LKAAIGFRDHHRYRRSDWLEITAAAHGVRWIVTTEKDLVKLAEFASGDVRLRALRIDVEVEGADAIVDSICARARLDARTRGQHDRARPRGTEA